MYYILTLKLTGQDFVCSSPGEILEVLQDFPLCTIKSKTLWSKSEPIDEWIKNEGNNFDIVYDTVMLSNKSGMIDNYHCGISLVDSEEWDGKFHNFSTDLLSDVNFFEYIVECPRFDDTLENLQDTLRQNIELVTILIENDKWYGSYRDIYQFNDRNLLLSILKSSMWDGDMCHFPRQLMNDKDFCICVINSSKWLGNVKFFHEEILNDPEFYDMLFKSPRWFGNSEYFSKDLLNNIDFCRMLIKSRRWDGFTSSFGNDVMNDCEFCNEVIKNDRWRGYYDNFSPVLLDDVSFCNKIVSTIKWRGTLFRFGPSVLKDRTFCLTIIKDMRWNGYIDFFDKDLLDDLDFYEEISKSPYWNGSVLGFSDRIVEHHHSRTMIKRALKLS